MDGGGGEYYSMSTIDCAALALGDHISTIDGADYLSNVCDFLTSLPGASEIKAWTGSGRFFEIDCGDYFLYVGVGNIIFEQARFVCIAGDYFPYRTKVEEHGNGKSVVVLPPFVFKYFKDEMNHSTPKQMENKIRRDFHLQLRDGFVKAGYKCEQDDDILLSVSNLNLNLNLGNQIGSYIKEKEEAHAHAHTWNMNKCNSSSDAPNIAYDAPFTAMEGGCCLSPGCQTVGDYISKVEDVDYLSSGAGQLFDHLSTLPYAADLIRDQYFPIDCEDHVLYLGAGPLFHCNFVTWVAGDYFPYRVNIQQCQFVAFSPPFVFKHSRRDTHLTPKQNMLRIRIELCCQLRSALIKAGSKHYKVFPKINKALNKAISDLRYEEGEAPKNKDTENTNDFIF